MRPFFSCDDQMHLGVGGQVLSPHRTHHFFSSETCKREKRKCPFAQIFRLLVSFLNLFGTVFLQFSLSPFCCLLLGFLPLLLLISSLSSNNGTLSTQCIIIFRALSSPPTMMHGPQDDYSS